MVCAIHARHHVFEVCRLLGGSGVVLLETERMVISDYRQKGVDLVNLTDGGEGNHGYKWSKDQLENISNVRTGRVLSEEWKKNISEALKGKKKPADFGEKVSKGKIGKKC